MTRLRGALRLRARRTFETSSERRPGELYLSRIAGRDLYFGWSPDRGVKGTGFTAELPEAEAVKLRDWLIEQFPDNLKCQICGQLGGLVCWAHA